MHERSRSIARLFWSRHTACLVALAGLWLGSATAPAVAQVPQRVVLALETPNSETNRFWAGGAWHRLGQALEMLVDNDPETGVYAGTALAERWEHNEDFTEWTFHLRRGVQFHHGFGEFTSADVLHSYTLSTAEESRLATVSLLRGAEVSAPDRYTVKFKFAAPQPEFLYVQAGRSDMYIYSKAQFDQEGVEGYDRRFAGTGPYAYVESAPGRVLYRRVDNHYSGVTPDFEEMELRFVDEPSTRLAMLLAGEAHIAVLSRELQKQALTRGMKIVSSKNGAMQTALHLNGLYCTTGDPDCRPDLPWYDVRVRAAMNHALNRKEMVEVLFEGRAGLSAMYGMRQGNEGYDPSIVERFENHYGYNPERARELLREAGYPERFAEPVIPLVMTALVGQPEVPTQMEMVQLYFQAVGLEADIREMDQAAMRAASAARRAYFIHPLRNAPIRPTETLLRSFFYPKGSAWAHSESDQLTAYLDSWRASTDPRERDELARSALNYMFDTYATVPLFEVHAEVAVDPRVVAGWTFPGTTTSGYSHWHLIEAAR